MTTSILNTTLQPNDAITELPITSEPIASNLQIYLPIKQTDTVFTKVLGKLYKDNEFQKNISRLENSTDKDKKKALIIKKTVGKIRVYGSSEQPLLLARDVGILMGISNIRLQLKYYSSTEKVIGLYQLNNGKTSQVEFLTWKGFIRAAGNSRSTLSDLFREFIYELVAEAIGDPSLLDKITRRVVERNPELVEQAMNELDGNLEYYRILYEREALQKQLLQENLDNEIQRRLIAEKKQADAELDSIVRDQKIQQIVKYANQYERTILNMYEWPTTNEIELNILRQKYLKPLHIYAPSSKQYNEWINKKDDILSEFLQYIPEYPDRIDYIIKRSNELVTNAADKTKAIKCVLPDADYCYFYIHAGQMPSSSKGQDEYVHISTEWIVDRKHYDEIVDEMNKECEKVTIKKKVIYYSSLEEIRCIISQKMIQLNQ